MSDIRQKLYGVIVRLHPSDFREQFGDEMKLDFDEAVEGAGFSSLCVDALVSLGRQWGLCVLPEREPQQAVQPSLLAGQYVMIQQYGLTAFAWVRSAVLCALIYFAIGCTISVGHGKMRADVRPDFATKASESGQSESSTSTGQIGRASQYRAQAAGVDATQSVQQASAGTQVRGNRAQPAHPELNGHGLMVVANESNFTGSVFWDRVLLCVLVLGVAWMLVELISRDPAVLRRVILGAFGILLVTATAEIAISHMHGWHWQSVHASSAQPSFEVASIRLWRPVPASTAVASSSDASAPSSRREKIVPLPGALTSDRMRMILPVNMLIGSAYGLPAGFEHHVLGLPDWATSEQYEIQATIEDSVFAKMQAMTPAEQRQQVALMERSLLVERFRMKAHTETREMPVFALVVTKGGAKLIPAKAGEATRLSVVNSGQGFEMSATAVPIEVWIHSPLLGGRQVVDETGLKGNYDFQLKWTREQPVASEAGQESAAEPPLLNAIQEQLGLKLVSTRGPVQVIVVDHIERPSVN